MSRPPQVFPVQQQQFMTRQQVHQQQSPNQQMQMRGPQSSMGPRVQQPLAPMKSQTGYQSTRAASSGMSNGSMSPPPQGTLLQQSQQQMSQQMSGLNINPSQGQQLTHQQHAIPPQQSRPEGLSVSRPPLSIPSSHQNNYGQNLHQPPKQRGPPSSQTSLGNPSTGPSPLTGSLVTGPPSKQTRPQGLPSSNFPGSGPPVVGQRKPMYPQSYYPSQGPPSQTNSGFMNPVSSQGPPSQASSGFMNPVSSQGIGMQQPEQGQNMMAGPPSGPPMSMYQSSMSQQHRNQAPGMSQLSQPIGAPPGMAHMTQPIGSPPSMGVGPMGRQPQPLSGPMAGPMGAAPQKRIDPNQMPNPIQVMNDDQQSFEGEMFQTSTRGKVPPLVSTRCRIQDDGNCSPRYMRSSVYSIPCNQDMLKESAIPIAIVSTPFAKIPEDEHQLRYVDHGPNGPVRCNRCKAYMNPFMQFIDGGRRFVCNICSHSNEVPQEYFSHLDHQGRRVDMYERPELCFGSYEFIATTDYCKDSKFPSPPAFIFMIDVSYQSVQQGMIKVLANELHTLLDNLPRDVGMEESLIRVGFVTYSTQLHFYNVKDNLAQPQMMVVTDLDDAFVPLLDGFFVNYKQAKAVVDSLLDMLPEMFKDTRETDLVLGPVIAAGIEALKSAGISGKLFVFHSSLPIAEAPGKLKNREDRKLLATDKEKTILVPNGNYYMNLAKECVSNGVSIDLFLFPNSYVDVATIGLMVTQTGGQIYRYSYFKEATHGEQFVSDLRKNFSREIGFDAIMRLRCSTGLRPVEFYGSFMMNNTTDVELASIDSHKAIAIEVKHDDKIPEDGVAFVQNALLYTSVSGQRRLRIHNLAFSTCSQLADLYRCCELDTTVNFLSKHALRQVLSSTPLSIKENLVQRCVQILACYRQHCATPSTSGQLILPECMKLLPLYVNCLIKSDVLAGGSEMSSDDRAFLMQACLSMNPAASASYFYPRLISLHTVDIEHEEDVVPDQMRCLVEKFEDGGVYLLENTISMFIWVGLQVDPRFLQDVFGINGIGQLDIEMTRLPDIDTPLSKRIRQIIETVQDQRQRYLKLTIVRQRDKLEPWFKHYVVEDKGLHASQLSYVDFLCHVHKEIRNLLS